MDDNDFEDIAKKAVETFDEILELEKKIEENPKDAEALRRLGYLYEYRGDLENAEKVIKILMKLEPGNPRYNIALGRVYVEWGKKDLAEKELKIVLAIDPKNCEAITSMGVLRYNNGQRQDAINCFRKVIELNPDDPEAYQHLSAILGQK